ncbi:OsmC family protein [Oryzihumus sp.]
MSGPQRSVAARWDGGLRAVVRAGEFDIVVDEPLTAGGSGSGPQPTDLFLGSVASCFLLALLYAAGKAGIDLPGLEVRATGTYAGLQFDRVDLVISSAIPAKLLEPLVPVAERVCYVTNTLRQVPSLGIRLAGPDLPPLL